MLYPEDNTDDEQEDLPYEGALQNTYQHKCDSRNLENSTCVEDGSQHVFTLTPSHMSCHSKEKSDCKTQLPETKINLATLQRGNDMESPKATEELLAWDVNSSGRNQHLSNSNISDVLLRHFPQEELSSLCQLIDSETLPEISFTESFDETILNKIKISESSIISLPKEEGKNIECCNSETEVKFESVDKNWDLTEVKQFVMDKSVNPTRDRKDCKEDNIQLVIENEHAINEDFHYFSTPKEVYQEHKYFLETTSHNLKNGQRQVHYRLPDFSKVAPKVKIPKGKNSNSCPIPKKTTHTPNLLGKSEVVKDVLEAMNSLDSVANKNEEKGISTPELDQQLELLTKQAEAQNHIDHLRFNTKVSPGIKSESPGITTEMSTVLPVTVPVKPMVGFSQSPFSELQPQRMLSPLPSADAARQSSGNQPLLQNITEEEKLSHMLKEQSEELKSKVETFSNCLTQDVFPVEERHQLLSLLKEQLDKLEWNYLATKEKHCTFQHQHPMYSSMSIGEFDPNRKVEGEIFKLGMLLEDIKEKIDKTACSPHSSAFVTSPSFTPCESASPYSSCSESPAVSNISESPQKTASSMNIAKNKKHGDKRSQPMEMIPPRMYQQSNEGSQHHRFHQNQLELQTKHTCEDIVNPLEKSGLKGNKQSTHQHCSFSTVKKAGGLQSHKPLIGRENQNDYSNQENTDGNLSYWEMRSPPPANPYNTSNQESNVTILKKRGSLTYPSDHRFLDELRNPAKDHIIIHPRMKIQLSSRHVCPCSSSRNKKMEHRKTIKEKPDCERYSIFLEGKAMDLDLSGSDIEDTSFSHLLDSSSSEVCPEKSIKSHESWTMGLQEQNEASSQKQSINLQRIYTKKQPEEFIERLCDRQNLHIPQTRYSRMHDTIILSPQYLTSRNIHGRSVCGLRNRHIKETHSKILSSTLDDVIQTANNLKKTTEHMVQVVSEDLAKAKIQTLSSLAASQY
ncbi:protein AKNAD1 [Zootoca vivipara]|uniref:protein AKNAD1 n=1 Tax=Zootoca vivipara TaxID=8524 RepID=UPI00293BF727|nr:protein AKNAD1 [Zootoca vivipara]